MYFTRLSNSALVSHACHPKCQSGPPAERDLHSFKPLRKETKGIIFSDTGSLYKNQISTFVNIILLECHHGHLFLPWLWLLSGHHGRDNGPP